MASSNEACLIYVTFSGRIYIYHSIKLSNVQTVSLIEAVEDNQMVKDFMTKIGMAGECGKLLLFPYNILLNIRSYILLLNMFLRKDIPINRHCLGEGLQLCCVTKNLVAQCDDALKVKIAEDYVWCFFVDCSREEKKKLYQWCLYGRKPKLCQEK